MTPDMSRRASLPALLLVPVLGPLLAACSGEAGPADLQVTVQDWTGSSEAQPEPSTRSITVSEGDTFDVELNGDTVTVTVAGIDGDGIELETDRDVAPRSSGGGIDLNDLEDSFELERGGSTRFSSPSLDSGTTVTIAEE